MPDVFTPEVTYGPWAVGMLTPEAGGPSYRTILLSSGGGSTPTAPVLTLTSVSGTNPPSWETAYTGLIIGTDSTTMRYRVNGGSWIQETPVPVTSDWYDDYIVDGLPYPWPEFSADAPFPVGALIEVQGGVVRGGNTVWSATISDTMAGINPVATSSADWVTGTVTTQGTNHTFTGMALQAGPNVFFLTCYSINSTLSSVPPQLNLTGAETATATLLSSGGRNVGRAIAIYTCDVPTTGTYSVQGTRPNSGGASVLAVGRLAFANLTPSTAAAFTFPNVANPRVSTAQTPTQYGIMLGAYMPEGGTTLVNGSVNSPTIELAKNTAIDGVRLEGLGLVVGYRASTGAAISLSFNDPAAPASTRNIVALCFKSVDEA
jgi:hypothetical protein